MLHRIRKFFASNSNRIPQICTIVNFCSNDYRFLHTCLKEVSAFSSQVLVPWSDHFFDGRPENLELVQKAIDENPGAEFVFLPYDGALGKPAQHWVTLARWTAFQKVAADADYVLFLDADEVVEGQRFRKFLANFPVKKFNVLKLANYYYFRESRFQAVQLEDSATLVRKSLVTETMVMDFEDRNKAWEIIPEPKQRMVFHADGRPMIHHFSWVRTKAEMLRKVESWGHSHERNWVGLVEAEFSAEFSGKDFVHGYQYQIVEPPFPEIGL